MGGGRGEWRHNDRQLKTSPSRHTTYNVDKIIFESMNMLMHVTGRILIHMQQFNRRSLKSVGRLSHNCKSNTSCQSATALKFHPKSCFARQCFVYKRAKHRYSSQGNVFHTKAITLERNLSTIQAKSPVFVDKDKLVSL